MHPVTRDFLRDRRMALWGAFTLTTPAGVVHHVGDTGYGEALNVMHMVRCFEDGDITHVEGKIDPIADIETIETELMLADLESLEKRVPNLEKRAKGGDKDSANTLRLALSGQLGPDALASTAVRDAFDAGATVPRRHAHALSGQDSLLLMPAWDQHLVITKLVTVMPGAAALGAVAATGADAADTTVALAGVILGKPADRDELLTEGTIRIVCVDAGTFRPRRIPKAVLQSLA